MDGVTFASLLLPGLLLLWCGNVLNHSEGAMKSSPTNALQVECVEPPLQLRRQYLSDSHSGIRGNENADLCAKEAARLGTEIYNKTFSRDIRALAKSHLFKSWDELWQTSKQAKGNFWTTSLDFPPNSLQYNLNVPTDYFFLIVF
ncbi:uncharacterized protein LOC126380164 isoform X2 [Pectinophora gossypiella]|uniref:uncharacterized protein LOC126370627 isoform X2 n=1 Tax=Pectinophora gossypiella TaxID=13191 RepID=UPI00214DFC49|nr:uncharacterized protein LOC126370627 isoform X2 [Pectinophora gossypiella]XP_049878544.1 uncharacterized protein LOC126375585 isoform X2 [Pectinophora gossypiella]XP_049885391.1 uncharacterized protein LOC126380164 isoform X2 [Pectinophora gossypiella]